MATDTAAGLTARADVYPRIDREGLENSPGHFRLVQRTAQARFCAGLTNGRHASPLKKVESVANTAAFVSPAFFFRCIPG
jgi:hypothetical protein